MFGTAEICWSSWWSDWSMGMEALKEVLIKAFRVTLDEHLPRKVSGQCQARKSQCTRSGVKLAFSAVATWQDELTEAAVNAWLCKVRQPLITRRKLHGWHEKGWKFLRNDRCNPLSCTAIVSYSCQCFINECSSQENWYTQQCGDIRNGNYTWRTQWALDCGHGSAGSFAYQRVIIVFLGHLDVRETASSSMIERVV